MFFCESCCNNHYLPCLNSHKYYHGVLCTCKCNWETSEEDMKSIILPRTEWHELLRYLEEAIDLMELNKLDTSDIETVIVRFDSLLKGLDLTK